VRGRRSPIAQRVKALRESWYQVAIAVSTTVPYSSTTAPYSLAAISLRLVRPRSARLMSLVKLVSTREGDFLG
jgi:hypothetical protein